MPYYQDADGRPHDTDEKTAARLKLVPVTQEEALALAAKLQPAISAQVVAQAEIDTLERQTLTPRHTREFMLGSIERLAVEMGAAQGVPAEAALKMLAEQNAGYAKVKALDERIAQLRAVVNAK